MSTSTPTGTSPADLSVRETLVSLIETLESPEHKASSPAFKPLTRVDLAILLGIYTLLPVILAIVVCL